MFKEVERFAKAEIEPIGAIWSRQRLACPAGRRSPRPNVDHFPIMRIGDQAARRHNGRPSNWVNTVLGNSFQDRDPPAPTTIVSSKHAERYLRARTSPTLQIAAYDLDRTISPASCLDMHTDQTLQNPYRVIIAGCTLT